jgi:hypothetical protein
MGGERQEASVVYRFVILPTCHHHFPVVIQTRGRQPLQMLESPDVLAERGVKVLSLGEAQVL